MIFTKQKVQQYADLGSIVEDNKNRLGINITKVFITK